MTQEEKAIAYDKAYKIAENIHRFSSDPAEIKRMEQIFPELKENKDEEIRKEIIEQINLLKSATLSDLKVNQFNSWIAWLENQAQKPVFEIITPEESLGIDSDTYNKIVDECIYGEQKPTNKVDPKFHKGYDSIKAGIQAHAETYSFNIESELFNQLTKEQQALWRREIEQACISGGYSGLNLANDPRYEDSKIYFHC